MKIPEANTDREDMYRTNYLAFASFSILIWDHIITFDKEVVYIWPARKNLLMSLFIINRYLTPLGFIVNLFAYVSPIWTPETCRHLVRYAGAMTVIGVNIVALMMFMRMKALYHGHRIILGLVAILGLASCTMNAYLFTTAAAIVHHPQSGAHGCTMVFEGDIIKFVSTSARLPLVYDTAILALTLYKTFPSLRNNSTSHVMRRLTRDGFLYYSVILSVAVIWSVMIVLARPGIQNIAAAPYLLLTVAMMSRITISLKSSIDEMKNPNVARPVLPTFTQRSRVDAPPSLAVVISQTTIDFGVDMDLRRNKPNSGPASNLGFSEDATSILSSTRARLSTILRESPDWDYNHRVDTSAGVSTMSPSSSVATQVGHSVGLDVIEEGPRAV